ATPIVQDNSKKPVLGTSPLPNDICDPLKGFAGSLTVSLSNTQAVGAFPADYTFTWYDGGTTATPHVPQPSPASTVTLSQLDVGTYTVTGLNNITGCLSLPATDQVANGKVNPAISLSSTGSHNCSNAITPDGTATATITNAGADKFNFVWTAVAPTTAINGTN